MMNQLTTGLFLTGIAAFCMFAQTLKKFDVAAIKPNAPGDNRIQLSTLPGGRFEATGVNLKMLIEQAYGVKDFQVLGGPGWLATARYDIQAKAAVDGDLTQEKLRPMLQSLLADRFKLSLHHEMRDQQSFELVIGKGGIKLQASADGTAATTGTPQKGGGKGSMSMGSGMIRGQGITMNSLADALGRQLGRVVVDKTGIAGNFDVDLKWTPDTGELAGMPLKGGDGVGPIGSAPVDTFGASIFTATQEQLGLRLDSTKTPVDVLIVDSAEKASVN